MNKKIYNEDLTLNLILNSEKVQPASRKLLTQLYELDQATRKLQLRNAELLMQKRQLNKADADYANKLKGIEREIRRNEKAINANQQAMMALRKEIGLAGLTINQLRTHLKVLQTMLNNTTDPKLLKQLRKNIDEVS